MKKAIGSLLLVTVAMLLFVCPSPAAGAPPKVGGTLPDFNLPVPGESADRDYLGLARGGSFKVPQIGSRVVIIEIFSMYCPFCQKEAPRVNGLYQAIENNPKLKGKIKVIGIGAGNSAYEVGIFKQRYNIPFPLFPDADYVLHELLGNVRTPYFIAIRIDTDGTERVIYSKLGAFKSGEDFLQSIIKSADLQ